MTERTAGAILEKRLSGKNQSLHAQNIKSAIDTLGDVSTDLETLNNGNAEFNAVVDESLVGVNEARVRVLGKVPQVIWINVNDDFSQAKEPEPVRQELIGERHGPRHKYKDTEGLISVAQIKVIDTEAIKPKEKRSRAKMLFEVKDLEAGNEYGEEDGLSLNIYFDEVRKTSFSAARTRTHARKIFKGEIALLQLEKILESGVVSGEISEEITTLLSQPKAKYLLLNLKNTIKSSRNADKDKNQGSYLTAKSAARQETWIRKKIENVSFGANEEMGTIITNRIKTAKVAFESFDSLVGENLKLAANWAYKYRGKGLPVADLIGLGNEGLMTAAAKYNYKTGYGFSTYAVWWIRQRIKRGIIETGQAIRLPVHIHETLSEISKIQKNLTQTLGREPTGLEVVRKAGISITNYRTIMNARNTDSLNKIVGRSEDLELEDKVARVEVDYDGVTYRAELREVVENALESLSKREKQVIEIRFGIGHNKRSKTLNAVGEELGVSRERARQIEDGALRKLKGLLRTYELNLRSDLLQNGRDNRVKSEVVDTRDIRAIKGLEIMDRKPPTVVVTAVKIDTDKDASVGKITEVAKAPMLVSVESKTTEYCSPGEIISILKITRQRWHQMKKDYQYRSKMVGIGEHILREDLMVIKTSYDKKRYGSHRSR